MGGPQVINPAKSPPLFLPIGMILAGLAGLLLLQPLLIIKAPLIFGEYRYNPAALAAVHLITLGWASAVMIGAFYQLTPVMLIGQPVAGRPALVQVVLYLAGSALLILGFYAYETLWIAVGGSLVVAAVLLFAWLIGRTLRSATAWTTTGSYMIAGLTFLVATVLWGLTLALNLRFNFLGDTLRVSPLGAHLILGLGGWFMLTIFGVSYQLFPMFALSSRGDPAPARLALGLLAGGMGGAFVTLALHLPASLTVSALGFVLAGIGVYGADMAAILRRRRRGALDLSMRYALTAFGFLALSLLLGLGGASGLLPVLGRTPAPTAAVWLFLMGFVSALIMGMLYKIVPFLWWHHLLKSRTDKAQRLPTLTQMYSDRAAVAGYWLWVTGVGATGGVLLAGAFAWLPRYGLWLPWPLTLVAAGSLLFAWTILQVLRAKPLN